MLRTNTPYLPTCFLVLTVRYSEGGTGLVFRQREETGHNGLLLGDGIQDTPAGMTAAFSVHDDKPLEYLNKIFFGQKHREPRHDSVNKAAEYLRACRPEPKVTTDKSNRKKCYLDILGEVFRTENAAVSPAGVSCMPSPSDNPLCPVSSRCRKTRPVPPSSESPTPPITTNQKQANRINAHNKMFVISSVLCYNPLVTVAASVWDL